jgi:hypothetical protein
LELQWRALNGTSSTKAAGYGRTVDGLGPTYCVEKLPVAVRRHFSVGPPTPTGTLITAPGSVREVDLDASEAARGENRVFQQNRPIAEVRWSEVNGFGLRQIKDLFDTVGHIVFTISIPFPMAQA